MNKNQKEINRKIAEELFGLKLHDYVSFGCDDSFFVSSIENCVLKLERVPDYLGNIQDAFKIVEYFKKYSEVSLLYEFGVWEFMVILNNTNFDCDCCDNFEDTLVSITEKPELAICNVALEYIRKNKKQLSMEL